MTTRLPDDAPKLGRYVALGIVLVVGALACLIQVGTLPQADIAATLETVEEGSDGSGAHEVNCTSLRYPEPSKDGYIDSSDADDFWTPTAEERAEIRDLCASRRAATAAKIGMYAGGGGFLGALGIGLLLTCHLLRVNLAPKRG